MGEPLPEFGDLVGVEITHDQNDKDTEKGGGDDMPLDLCQLGLDVIDVDAASDDPGPGFKKFDVR